jgi:hypothetical protein
MPVFDIETPSGKVLSIEAADQDAALAGAQQWHAQNSTTEAPAAGSDFSRAKDIAKGVGTGLVKGEIGLLGMPADLGSLGQAATDATLGRASRAVLDPVIETVFGMPSGTLATRRQNAPQPPDLLATLGSANIQKQMEKTTGALPEAQTVPGQYAETGASFLPGGALFGGLNSARRAATEVVLPALASETAGQATKGSAAEPYARVAAGALPQVVAGVARARSSAPERAIQGSTSTVTPPQWDAAQELQAAGQRVGVPLSGPEAVAGATGGETRLPHLLRAVEGSTEGGTVSAPFFAARPQQVEAAVGRNLDVVGPQDPRPSTLGPRTAAAADEALMRTPEGQQLQEAIWRAGPRTSPEEAGNVIQPALREVYDRREGMRAALADRDYAAARDAPAGIPVESLEAGTFTPPNRTTLTMEPTTGEYHPTGGPAVTPPPEPALSSNTGATHIQVDPRDVLSHIDTALADAKGATADALRQARQTLFSGQGLDTSVAGLSNARTQIGTAINDAVRSGDGHTAQTLRDVQRRLDETLSDVPEYAAATRGFEAASRPLDPFTETPALDKTIAHDEFNRNFATPAEQVPGAIQQGGASTARAFNGVAPPEARDAFMNYLTTRLLDPATNAAGRVNPDALTTTVRDNVDLLRQHPEVGQRLTSIIMADRGMAGPRSGPLGELAQNPGGRGTLNGTQAAADTLMPAVPLSGSQGEIGQATRQLVEASAGSDPNVVPSLVRQGLSDRFDQAAQRVQSGRNQFVGAKFANEVVGTPQREANLNAVIGELPNGARAQPALAEMFDVLRATGQRRAEGSPTAFNQERLEDLKNLPIGVQAALAPVTAFTSVTRGVRDTAQRAWLGRNTGRLAEMFTSPDAVQQMRAMAERRLGHPISDALVRQLIQTPAEMNR